MKRRNTPAKQEVMAMLEESDSALSGDMIEQQLKGRMDRVTVYRILNSFCEDGIVHRVTSDEGKNYYALCHNCEAKHHRHDHFHFRCVNCHRVECLHEEVHVKLPKGYTYEHMNCWVSGLCKACKNVAKA